MSDQDFLLPGHPEEFGSGVIGVCDVCGRRQAVIVLQKERFKLCVLDFLNKTWSTSGKSPGAPLPPYRSERVWFPTREQSEGRAPAIALSPTRLAKRPVLLVTPDVYGMTTTLLDAAIRFARDGFEVLVPDVAQTAHAGAGDHVSMRLAARTRGGLRVDSPRLGGLVSLYRDALQYLRGREMVDGEKVGLFGVSYGGSLAALLAGLEPRVSAVGLAYPVPLRPAAALGVVSAPTLVVAGARDAVARRFLADLNGRPGGLGKAELLEIPEVGHDFLGRDVPAYRLAEAERAWARFSEFFKRQLFPPPPKLPAAPVPKPSAAGPPAPGAAPKSVPPAAPPSPTSPGPPAPATAAT